MFGAPRTIPELIETQARLRPGAEALLAPGRLPLGFAQLSRQVAASSSRLAELGLGRADRVAVAMPTTPEAAVTLLAITSAAIVAPLPCDLPREEAEQRLAGLGARALVAPAGDDGPLVTAARALRLPVLALAPREGVWALQGERIGEPVEPVAARPDDVAAILHTSGTTALPKRVPLTHANLAHAARVGSASLALAPEDRGLWFAPLYHVGGLLGAIAYPLASGGTTVLLPAFDPDRFFGWLEEFRPTWFWGVPTMHQAILDRASAHHEVLASLRLRYVRSAAAPLSATALEQLESTFRAPVLEGYGMTEAGLISSNPPPPARRKAGSVGVAVGAEIAIVDEAGKPVAQGAEGEVVVRGPGVMRGYDGDPEATRAAFREGWLRTGDLGSLDDDGYLAITGRLKEQINRGGQKVSPRAVDEALLAHPAVARAAAFPVSHARLGEDLAAAVVLREGRQASAGELRAFVARRLAPPKVPGRIVVVDAIPTGPTGKVQRAALAKTLGLTSAARAGEAPAELAPTRIEAAMCRIWAEVLGLDIVGPEDDFFDLGGDSVAAARLMARVAEEFHVELPAVALFEAPTPGGLLLLARARDGERPPLVPVCGDGRSAPFVFCIGAAPLLRLRNLARRLTPEHLVYALSVPALMRPTPTEVVEEFAARGLAQVRGLQPRGPYRLGGFCFGAVLAFEMARELVRAGEGVELLALFDPPPLPPRFRHRVTDRVKARVAVAVGRGSGVPRGEPLRRALARYRPGVHSGRTLLFLSGECPPDGPEASEAAWRRLLRIAPEVHRLRAAHSQLFDEPFVAEMAAALSRPAVGSGVQK